MARDFSKLIGLIHEKYKSRTAFCNALNKAPEWLSRRINNQVQFSADDITSIVELLGISPEDISLYFFTPNVR